jgi:hypothetical protein
MHIPITININTDHVSITGLSHDEAVQTWDVNAAAKIPDGLVYDDIQWPCRVDRMHLIIGPVVVPDAMMQMILGEQYAPVVSAMSLGTFMPSRAIQELIILALGAQ